MDCENFLLSKLPSGTQLRAGMKWLPAILVFLLFPIGEDDFSFFLSEQKFFTLIGLGKIRTNEFGKPKSKA
jgi:hypothetical protein